MIYYQSKKQKNRTYAHLHLNNIFEIKDHLKDLRKPFVLFLCCDGSDYKEEELSEFASHIVKNGLCFLDVWGKDPSRIEFLFDKIIMSTEKSIIPTVPHDNEELEEALSFFINYSFGTDMYGKIF